MVDIVERLRDAASQKFTQKGQVFQLTVCGEAANEIERLREALQSIASNTCCEGCQEAALVARAALKEKE